MDLLTARSPRFAVGALALLLSAPSPGADVSDYELRRLMDPTEAELARERNGRIYIYEGLRDIDIEQAMSDEFDRVEHMMFIRTRKTDGKGEVVRDAETGEAVIEDDGC